MPTTPNKQQPPEMANENVLVIIGRMLEATKAASDAIKTLSEESRANSVAYQTLQQTVAGIQVTLSELDKLVRSDGADGDGLLTRMKLLSDGFGRHVVSYKKGLEDAKRLEDRVVALEKVRDLVDTKDLENRTEALEKYLDNQGAKLGALWWFVGGITWLVTTLINLYSAWKK